ncbi:hypothetical protein MSAN_02033800 [Mycena sanguinolenta]|uniref:Tetraspanin Tsp2 n=1 Tax=Mycena sanguinolenta TaxID=230812 RepID=A0A8H6XHU9_9AGAR|nr:hypothetical protein MSAN_02033800 [Mycena sanguinolenta]
MGNASKKDRPTSPAPSTHSHTLNYLPSKFSHVMVSRRRNHEKGLPPAAVPGMPRGGGVAAFRADAARMPSEGDEDYDGVDVRRQSLFPPLSALANRKLRWTRFKSILFFANVILSIYSLTALIFVILTYLRTLSDARVILVANGTELALSALAASVMTLTAALGWPAILLNNRAMLAFYTLLLWVSFGLMVVPGYVTYKRRNLNLDGKINQQWSQTLGASGRLTVQDSLGCCGYFSPFVEATVSTSCYARSVLPGCKAAFFDFEQKTLARWYTIAFGLVPVHIGIIVAALLCSNHVTYRFGKGMMPKAYRLSREAMAAIVEKYAMELAEQYGPDTAAQLLAPHTGTNPPSGYSSSANLLSPHAGGGSGANSPYASGDASPAISSEDLATMPFERHAKGGSGGGFGFTGHGKNESGGAGGAGDRSHVKYDSIALGGE